MNCKQKSEETISHYVYRLREMATVAYSSDNEAEEQCLLAFIRGIHVARIKRKMNEAVLTSFKSAIKFAKRLERAVEQETGPTKETVTILRESATENGDPEVDSTISARQRGRSSTPHYDSRNSERSGSRSRDQDHNTGHDRSETRNRSPYQRNNRSDRDRSNSRGRSSNRYNRDSSPDRFSNEASNPNQSSHQRNVSHGHQNRNKSDILCWTCLNPGHYSKNCYSNPNRRSNRRDYKSNNVRFSDNLN